jgi:hypothetical protein
MDYQSIVKIVKCLKLIDKKHKNKNINEAEYNLLNIKCESKSHFTFFRTFLLIPYPYISMYKDTFYNFEVENLKIIVHYMNNKKPIVTVIYNDEERGEILDLLDDYIKRIDNINYAKYNNLMSCWVI